MTKRSVAQGAVKPARKRGDASPSTRELVCDDQFCELLAEDVGLKPTTVRTALIGEPKVRAIRVTEWLLRTEPDDPERRGKVLVWWARKRKAGAFAEDDAGDESLSGILDRYGEEAKLERLAKALAAMWAEHPESLAEAIRALEQSRKNGAA